MERNSSKQVIFGQGDLRIFRGKDYQDLPSEQIQRIEIRRAGRFSHQIVENAAVSLGLGLLGFIACSEHSMKTAKYWGFCFIPVTAVAAPFSAGSLAYTAVSTPFFLAAMASRFCCRPKVYEIVHQVGPKLPAPVAQVDPSIM